MNQLLTLLPVQPGLLATARLALAEALHRLGAFTWRRTTGA
jgi:hypothetical protein